jgi:epoxide hydrolase-like predicted phosphatase
MIRVIIFDFGGVIGREVGFDVLSEKLHKKYKVSKETLKELITTYWEKARIGSISSDKFWYALAVDLKRNPEEIRNDFMVMSNKINNEMVYLIQKLRSRYKLVLLSNHIEDWLEEIINENSLRDLFDLIVTSYDMKIAKPDERLFAFIKNKLHVAYNECLVIDDLEKNTSAAKSLGMKTVLYNNIEFRSLLAELLHFGIELSISNIANTYNNNPEKLIKS